MLFEPLPDLAAWPWLLAACVTGPLGMYAGIVALRYAEASELAPFQYTRLLMAILGGVLLFGEVPDFDVDRWRWIDRTDLWMGAPRISVFLWRLDALQERAARARHAWLQAKAASDERRLLLTDTKGIWPQKLDKWLPLNRPGGSR